MRPVASANMLLGCGHDVAGRVSRAVVVLASTDGDTFHALWSWAECLCQPQLLLRLLRLLMLQPTCTAEPPWAGIVSPKVTQAYFGELRGAKALDAIAPDEVGCRAGQDFWAGALCRSAVQDCWAGVLCRKAGVLLRLGHRKHPHLALAGMPGSWSSMCWFAILLPFAGLETAPYSLDAGCLTADFCDGAARRGGGGRPQRALPLPRLCGRWCVAGRAFSLLLLLLLLLPLMLMANAVDVRDQRSENRSEITHYASGTAASPLRLASPSLATPHMTPPPWFTVPSPLPSLPNHHLQPSTRRRPGL